jgi:hypothetical protein
VKKIYIYDIEIFINLFLIVFFDIESKEFKVFEISKRRNDSIKLILFLKNNTERLIGFNNVLFDYPLLHFFIKLISKYSNKMPGSRLVSLLYDKAQSLINSTNRWSNNVIKPYIPQTDLFLINHFDNFARATSLKILEFNMRMDNIQELPFNYKHILADDEIDKVIDYCKNDVTATYKFYQENLSAINYRQKMSKIHNHSFINYNEVKIGERILLNAVAKAMNKEPYIIKNLRTLRDEINIRDIMLPYIKFKTTPFITLLNWWKEKVITETKGQFTELDMEDVAPLLPYCNNKTKKGKLKNLNIILNNFQFDFGTGGLHGASRAGIWEADDEYELILIDVSSYYPNLAFNNKFHPEHIPVEIFMDVIEMLYNQRMKGKEIGDMEIVKSIKAALNGALYGKSNSEHSFMYDPKFMMQICISGQLLLSMLAEQCILHNFELIQVNTDGIMIKIKKSERHLLDNITNQWMKLTGLKLDYDFFTKIVQRDVNNYIAVYSNGKTKYKGVFDYKYAENGDWEKNFSMLIIPKALEAYFIHNVDPISFLETHTDLYDYFKRTKFGRDSKLIKRLPDEDIKLQNITRYYISTDGDEFIKIMKPLPGKDKIREFAVEKGYLCTDMNFVTSEKLKKMKTNINYLYYLKEIYKIINVIIKP